MQKSSKILVMIVRVLSIISIVLGVLVWTGKAPNMIAAHIGSGFLITICLISLGIMALLRRAIAAGVLGVVFALLLPYFGFRQFPLVMDATIGVAQILHVIIAIIALGIAEMANGAIQKTNVP